MNLPPFVVADTFLPRNVTVTLSPSVAQPHTGARRPCCRTILSENRPGSLTSARGASVTPTSNGQTQSQWVRNLFGIMADSATQAVAAVNGKAGVRSRLPWCGLRLNSQGDGGKLKVQSLKLNRRSSLKPSKVGSSCPGPDI